MRPITERLFAAGKIVKRVLRAMVLSDDVIVEDIIPLDAGDVEVTVRLRVRVAAEKIAQETAA